MKNKNMDDRKIKELWDKIYKNKNVIIEEMEEEDDNNQDVDDEGSSSMVELISKLLNSRNQVHIFHLQVKDYAQHMALNGYYDGIGDLVDGVVESYQGKYDIITGYSSEEYKDFDSNETVISYLKGLANDVESVRKQTKESFIQNQLDTISELLYSTIYKLRFLK
jgi:predicted Zn-dependent peptidase